MPNVEVSLATACAESIASLKRSLTFRMSLGAKELFHTNFLAFLLEDRSEYLADIQCKLRKILGLERIEGEEAFCCTWREAHKLDLIVMPIEARKTAEDTYAVNSERALVIEGKLKSVPTHGQLKTYNDKIEAGISLELADEFIRLEEGKPAKLTIKLPRSPTRVLLAPRSDYLEVDQLCGWSTREWMQVLDCLKLNGCQGDSLVANLLVDYRAGMNALLHILRQTETITRECDLTWGVLLDKVLHKQMKDLRIHDLVSKYAYWLRLTTLQKDLEKYLENVSAQNWGDGWSLDSAVFYSNQTPGITFRLVKQRQRSKKEKFQTVSLGIQIQGKEYRHFVSSEHESTRLKHLAAALWPWLRGTNPRFFGLRRRKNQADSIQRAKEVCNELGDAPLPEVLRKFNAKKFLYSARFIGDNDLASTSSMLIASVEHLSESLGGEKVQQAIAQVLDDHS